MRELATDMFYIVENPIIVAGKPVADKVKACVGRKERQTNTNTTTSYTTLTQLRAVKTS